jgi:DnaJ-class molecular chaperone
MRRMRKLPMKPPEKRCTACNGTGHLEVVKPAKPTIRIYPPQCKECGGKGRISENAA